MNYDYYNREERALCAHLFRLLHDLIPPNRNGEYLEAFLQKSDYYESIENINSVGIYCEVALIRDAYYARKPNTQLFMDQLVQEVAKLKGVRDCRIFSELPELLRDPTKTHPKQIRRKAKTKDIQLTKNEGSVYGFIQAIFNAKPDLVITIDGTIIAYEAKYTQPFDPFQIERTKEIASIWSNLLYNDLGFDSPPKVQVSTIGPDCFGAEVTWEWIFELSKEVYQVKDRTYQAFSNAVKFIENEIVS